MKGRHQHPHLRVVFTNGVDYTYCLTDKSARELALIIARDGLRSDHTYILNTPAQANGSSVSWCLSNVLTMGIVWPPEVQYEADVDLRGRYVHPETGSQC